MGREHVTTWRAAARSAGRIIVPTATLGRAPVIPRALRFAMLPAAAVVAILVAALVVPLAGAKASPGFVHGAAQSCQACHHVEPSSFAPCSSCHESAATPNQACTLCHPGKETTGQTCWTCHQPGADMPAPTDENCAACHSAAPHLGASAACTSCHSTSPTPHHDGVDQVAPATCTDCHQHAEKQSHGVQACTACHATDTHPSFPQTPAVCSTCHPPATFGERQCLECHAGAAFNGQIDNDLHDATLPDGPISAKSCTSCHPGKQKHAGGAAGCRDCHTAATAFHHGTAESPGYPACGDCHGQKKQHGSGLSCTSCHAGAQHQTDPPTPDGAACNQCHESATFGSTSCLRCHRPPIYHVEPQVGPCSSCHGSGRSRHAGKVACTTCHRNIKQGHHRGTVSALSCGAKGCHTQEKHVGTVRCTSCHARAQHDRTPRNLPADTWSVCGRCHTFTVKALAAGVGACSACHDATQHRASYRVDACTTCHAGKEPHQKVVPCELCHIKRGEGHHKVGKVEARECSACHLQVQVHASAAGSPRAMSCASCHEGSMHGTFRAVDATTCVKCHEGAPLHANGFQCTDCHWPAVHAQTPDPGKYGVRAPLPLQLPRAENGTGSSGTPDAPEPREEFSDTGADMGLMAAVAALFIAAGAAVRRKRRGPTGGRW